MHLAELALDFAVRHLRPEGVFLIKVFQGEGFDDFRRALGAAFPRRGGAQAQGFARSQCGGVSARARTARRLNA